MIIVAFARSLRRRRIRRNTTPIPAPSIFARAQTIGASAAVRAVDFVAFVNGHMTRVTMPTGGARACEGLRITGAKSTMLARFSKTEINVTLAKLALRPEEFTIALASDELALYRQKSFPAVETKVTSDELLQCVSTRSCCSSSGSSGGRSR